MFFCSNSITLLINTLLRPDRTGPKGTIVTVVNKPQLIDAVARTAGITKVEAKKSLDALIDAIGESLKDEGRINLPRFGTFVVTRKSERTGRDPRNGNPIRIPARNVVKFRPGTEFSERLK